jgi:FdhE protein
MPFTTAKQTSWEQRSTRAEELTKRFPFAAEILSFYREIARFQNNLYGYLHSCAYATSGIDGRLPETLDLFILLPRFQSLLFLVERIAPEKMSCLARDLEKKGSAEWEAVLQSFWLAKPDDTIELPSESFFAHAFLQPLAEYFAEHAPIKRENYARALCPFCGRKPAVGTLRPEGDGAKRSLVCSLCATEWLYRRLVCPSCGEENVHQLPIYTAEELEHVRVEACDTCKRYIKTVDLSKNGLAVPLVDEIASVPLTLWAEEKRYQKLQPNLLGM